MTTPQPFQIVCQPGSPSAVRARKPPKRATPRRTQEVPIGGEAFCWLLKLGGKDLDHRLRHVCRGGAIAPGGLRQTQETNGDDGQTMARAPRDQPVRLLELPRLGPTAGFPGL
jgi:hypothetical protein